MKAKFLLHDPCSWLHKQQHRKNSHQAYHQLQNPPVSAQTVGQFLKAKEQKSSFLTNGPLKNVTAVTCYK